MFWRWVSFCADVLMAYVLLCRCLDDGYPFQSSPDVECPFNRCPNDKYLYQRCSDDGCFFLCPDGVYPIKKYPDDGCHSIHMSWWCISY